MITANFQMGKSGLTENFIEALGNAFRTHKAVKIAFLKSSTRDKGEMKKIGEDICSRLATREFKFEYMTIGFTMTVRKFRKR